MGEGGVLLREASLTRELNLDGIFTSGGREGAHLCIPAEEEAALFAWRKQQTLKISHARGDSLLPARYTHFLPPSSSSSSSGPSPLSESSGRSRGSYTAAGGAKGEGCSGSD